MILEEPINTVVVFGGYQYFIILFFDEKGKTQMQYIGFPNQIHILVALTKNKTKDVFISNDN